MGGKLCRCSPLQLHAVVAATGAAKWTYTTGSYVHSSPTLGADGSVYVGSMDNNLYALTAAGKLLWSAPTGGSVYSSPAISADGVSIYVGAYDFSFYCFFTANGTKRCGGTLLLPSRRSHLSLMAALQLLLAVQPSSLSNPPRCPTLLDLRRA